MTVSNVQRVKELILEVLKDDERLWSEGKTEFNQTLLIDLVENIDEKIIYLLLQQEELREKFFVKIKDVYVFKTNDFRFFMEENKVDNSYTAYKNRIGLTDGKRFLKDSKDVVLDWPYKDCVLEGGQSTEEGTDVYYEQNKSGKYEQQKAKRKETFYNQVLAHDEIDRLFDPKALVNWKRYTANGEEKVQEIRRDEDGNIKENLIIKGNNLLALHSVKKQFAGKVKLIYIDPPYNTGNDEFKYNDSFIHSTWLTFMKNRLEAAWELLTQEGAIFIQCDYNQDGYLRVLMDELFGTKNFVANIAVKSSTPSGTKTTHKNKKIIKQKDTILFYKKEKINLNPQYTPREDWDSHYSLFLEKKNNGYVFKKLINVLKENGFRYDKLEEINPTNEEIRKFLVAHQDQICRLQSHKNKEIDILSRTKYKDEIYEHYVQGELKGLFYNGQVVTPISQGLKEVFYLKTKKEYWSVLLCDFWGDIDFQNTQNEGGVSLANGKKPEALIQRIINLTTTEEDIVLDFHLGSGTTCAVAHKLGRQFIGIEQLNYGENDSVVRLKNVINGDQSGISKSANWQGGGDFVYFELAKWNEAAKEKILACGSLEQLILFFDEMYEQYFLNYNLKIKEFKEKVVNEEEFKSLALDQQKQMFIAMLDNNQMYVNQSEMADKKYEISEDDQNLSEEFYRTNK